MAAGVALALVGLVVALAAPGDGSADVQLVDPQGPPGLRRLWGIRGRGRAARWGLVIVGVGLAVAGCALRPRRRPDVRPAPDTPPPLPPPPRPAPRSKEEHGR